MFMHVACFWMCVLFYFSFVCLHVRACASKFKVHCGSAFELGASRLPHYCTPPECVPDVIGVIAVWRHNTKKKSRREISPQNCSWWTYAGIWTQNSTGISEHCMSFYDENLDLNQILDETVQILWHQSCSTGNRIVSTKTGRESGGWGEPAQEVCCLLYEMGYLFRSTLFVPTDF